MNAKKIFKTILGVGTLVGTAYVAYRTGYQNGKDAKLPEKSGTDEFDGTGDEDDDSDEDSDSLNDAEEIPCEPEPEVPDISEETSRFRLFSEIDIGDIYIAELEYALQIICDKTYIFNKTLRDYLRIDSEEADKILDIFENAGYISEKDNRSGRKVYINWEDYKKLYGCDAVQFQ